jgi:hypothetical protein
LTYGAINMALSQTMVYWVPSEHLGILMA